jgi:hypothetical protein
VASRNVYDFYLENLLGKSKLNSKGSFVGRIYRSIEGPIDKYLSESTPGVAKVWNAATEWMGKAQIWSKDEQARKDFDSLSQHLASICHSRMPPHSPRPRAMGQRRRLSPRLLASMNRFTAAVVLRMFETIHPVDESFRNR